MANTWRSWFILWTITKATDDLRCSKGFSQRSQTKDVAANVLVRRKRGEVLPRLVLSINLKG